MHSQSSLHVYQMAMTMCQGSMSCGNGTVKTTQYEVSVPMYGYVISFFLLLNKYTCPTIYLANHGLTILC